MNSAYPAPPLGAVPSTVSRLSDGSDVVEIVDRHVRALIDWYQRKKRWPRRLYRASNVGVMVLGAIIPVLSTSGTSFRSQVLPSVAGVAISGLTGVETTTDWKRRWQILTAAQTQLEVRLADWEVAIAKASLHEPERARQLKVEATEALLAAAALIRVSETEEYFVNQPQTGGNNLAAWRPAQAVLA